MALEGIIQAIAEQEWIDTPANKLQQFVHNVYDSLEPNASIAIRNFLHGKWLGHPLHPAITDMPIGAWTSALILDALDTSDERKGVGAAADTLIAVGLVSAAGAAVAGATDWYKLRGTSTRRIGATHALMNSTASILYGTSIALRAGGMRGPGKVLGLLGYTAAFAGAWLGGHLSYRETVGMDHTSHLQPPEDFSAVLPDADLPEGELRRVEVDDVDILLYREGPRIYAMIETCAHFGGPLSEGHVHEGTVACPWHGSRFELSTGSVVEGPTVYPQPYFETRVRDGQIEVRLQQAEQQQSG
jgi:nitrite reductase/ring-hydroxylating ferredoxin subunit/uncharacterized membrane protein